MKENNFGTFLNQKMRIIFYDSTDYNEYLDFLCIEIRDSEYTGDMISDEVDVEMSPTYIFYCIIRFVKFRRNVWCNRS